MLLLWLSLARAAFPETDPAERRVDLTKPGATRGAWTGGPDGLAMTAPDAVGTLDYWLADAPMFTSGMIRTRIRVGDRLDSTILFRASVDPKQSETLTAYGLSLEREAVGFFRWTDGGVVPLAGVPAPGLGKHAKLEVLIYAIGPHFTATVYDGETLAPIVTVAAHDRTIGRGRLGIRAFPRQDAATVVEHLAVLDQAAAAPAPDPAHDAFGPVRLWELPAAAPGPLGLAPVRTDADRAWYLVTPEQAELARRAGAEPRIDTGHLPKWTQGGPFASYTLAPPQVGPAGVTLDDHVYRDPAAVEAALRAFERRYPDLARVVELGRTHQGRAILALRVGDHPDVDEDEPAVLLDGAHHGSELLSIDYALDALASTLARPTDPRVARWLSDLDLWFVPDVNPDGTWNYLYTSLESGRKNARDLNGDGQFQPWEGVDLNRNYPFQWGGLGEKGSRSFPAEDHYRGPGPATEPEVRALMALAERYRFVAAISWHTLSTVILSPYTIDDVANPSPDVAWGVAEAIAATLPKQPNNRKYKVQRKIYSVDGTDQDWHFATNGTLAYIVEGSHHNPKDPDVRQASILGIRGFYESLLDRVATGPRVFGHTRDEDGRPLSAIIEVDPLTTANGEAWTSRPRDGRFDRIVPGPGDYVVRARAPGYAEVVAAVTVADAPIGVELVLPAIRAAH